MLAEVLSCSSSTSSKGKLLQAAFAQIGKNQKTDTTKVHPFLWAEATKVQQEYEADKSKKEKKDDKKDKKDKKDEKKSNKKSA